MKRYVGGESRSQSTLFPESLDDYTAEDNPVRVVDVFVDELGLKPPGFDGAEPEATGRPAYHPATLLKIYIYGYLKRIQSSRRLERETQRNVELIWLTGRLSPDFETIADFRKDNGKAIRRVCREFVLLCRSLNLFAEALVAIDGSKFEAVNGRDRNFTKHKLKARLQQLEESIARYLADLDRADRDPGSVTEAREEHLKEKVETVKAQTQRLNGLGEQMAKTPDEQISLTDPDARSMATSARGFGVVGYNVQTVVDAKHHLVVTHEVTNKGTDRAQLSSMGQQAQEALGTEKITALADRGYYAGPEISPASRPGSTRWCPSPIPRTTWPRASSISATSTTTPRRMNAGARPGSARCGASRRSRTARRSTRTGHRRARAARSRRSARRGITGASRAGSTRPCSRRCRHTWRRCRTRRASAANRRTRLWHPQELDGRHALPDEATTQRANRDELARPGLQLETRDADPRSRTIDEGDQGLKHPSSSLDTGNQQVVHTATGSIHHAHVLPDRRFRTA
jgi:transposase